MHTEQCWLVFLEIWNTCLVITAAPSVGMATNLGKKSVNAIDSPLSTPLIMLAATPTASPFQLFSMLRKQTLTCPDLHVLTKIMSCFIVTESVAPPTIRLANHASFTSFARVSLSQHRQCGGQNLLLLCLTDNRCLWLVLCFGLVNIAKHNLWMASHA